MESPAKPRLLEQVSRAARLRHLSICPEEAYRNWIRRFVRFHGTRHPKALGPEEVRTFLSSLATEGKVAASTQNQALAALLFLYRYVLEQPLPQISDVVRARRPKRLPIVWTREEARRVLSRLRGTHALVGGLMHGSGLRLLECLRLRVKDVDFAGSSVIVRDGKGGKDRVTMLPTVLAAPLQKHLQGVEEIHAADLAMGSGKVYLPDALARKYPNAARSWGWQYVFPSAKLSADPRSGEVRRHHLSESAVQKAVTAAVREAKIAFLSIRSYS